MSVLPKYPADRTVVDPCNLPHGVTISSIGQGVEDVWHYLWRSLFEDEIRCVCYD